MALDHPRTLPQIEVAVADNAVGAGVARARPRPPRRTCAAARVCARARACGFYLQPGGIRSGVADWSGPAPAARAMTCPSSSCSCEFAPTDFVQVNGAVNRGAGRARRGAAGPGRQHRAVLDLYCGLGNFTLALARPRGRVVGVEGETRLVERARHNARCNGIANVAVPRGAIWRSAADGAGLHGCEDPTHTCCSIRRAPVRPRGAAAPWPASSPERVLYISCHPGSLARDLGVLVHEHGFDARSRRSRRHVPPYRARRVAGAADPGRRRRAPLHDPRPADDRPGGTPSPPRSGTAAPPPGRRCDPVHTQLRRSRSNSRPWWRRSMPRAARR